MLQLFVLLALQDEAVELKWHAEKEEKLDLKWTYDEQNTRIPGTGERLDIVDKRAVEAEMTPREEPGKFDLAIKKVSWTYSNNEFQIVMNWAGGSKPPVAAVKMKVDPKASNAAAAKAFAEQRAEGMEKLAGEGDYALVFDPVTREARILRNNAFGPNQTLFDVLFLHSPLPKGTVTNGQTWKESLEHMRFPQLVEVKMMNCKVSYSGPGVAVKGGFTQPIARPPGAKGETISGNFTFVREFTFDKAGCLLNSKEEQVFTKKVDAKGDNADFYKENSTHTIKQAIAFKRAKAKK